MPDVLPIVGRTTWTACAGSPVDLPVSVANDGPALAGVELEVTVCGETVRHGPLDLPAHTASSITTLQVTAPADTGTHELTVRLTGNGVEAENRYPLHVVAADIEVRGDASSTGRRRRGRVFGGVPSPDAAAPLVVAEGGLDAESGAAIAAALAAGAPVLVLAQDADSAHHLPIDAELTEVATAWGSTPFLFTTAETAVPSLPPARVLTTEPMPIVPDAVWTRLGGNGFPPVVIAGLLKPFPDEIAGTVVGEIQVGEGRLVVCQFPLREAVRQGDPLATAVLTDLLRHLVDPKR